MHERVAAQQAGVGQKHVAGVQHPHLHEFERHDIVADFHPDGVKGRPPGAEPVFDHPLGEGFPDRRQRVIDAAARVQPLARGGRHLRGDPVDHAVGEGGPAVDPACQFGVAAAGKGNHGQARRVAVMAEVVAGHHREGGQAGLPPPAQGLDDEAESRARRSARQVQGDIGRLEAERARDLVDIVTPFGDGERNDPGFAVRQPGENGFRVFRRVQVVHHGADHPRGGRAVGGVFGHRIKVILAAVGDGLGARVGRVDQFDAANAPLFAAVFLEITVEVDGQVDTVKVPNPEMNDPGTKPRPIVTRHFDRGAELAEGRLRQRDHIHLHHRASPRHSRAIRRVSR